MLAARQQTQPVPTLEALPPDQRWPADYSLDQAHQLLDSVPESLAGAQSQALLLGTAALVMDEVRAAVNGELSTSIPDMYRAKAHYDGLTGSTVMAVYSPGILPPSELRVAFPSQIALGTLRLREFYRNTAAGKLRVIDFVTHPNRQQINDTDHWGLNLDRTARLGPIQRAALLAATLSIHTTLTDILVLPPGKKARAYVHPMEPDRKS